MFICKKCKRPSINEICDDCKKQGDGVTFENGVNVKLRKPQSHLVFQGKSRGVSFRMKKDNLERALCGGSVDNFCDRGGQNYLVFQGKGNGASFCTQMDNRIIWAPKCNENGNTFSFWERIKELQEGDKIFHAVAGHIVAVSVVKKSPTGQTMPFPLDIDGNQLIPGLVGYFAELKISHAAWPISYKDYKYEILKCRTKNIGKGYFGDANDFPFNKNGGGQFGYLYHLPQELADLFESEIKRINYKK